MISVCKLFMVFTERYCERIESIVGRVKEDSAQAHGLCKKKRYLEPGFPVLWEAVTAIDGSALCWLKGDFTFTTAICADCL
jgi:hypothetical protein